MILELHYKGLSAAEILSEIVKIYPTSSIGSIHLRLSRNGIRCNKWKMPRRAFLNEDYFEKINSERVAYFFGLICADGCVRSAESRITLGLRKEDGYLIHELKKEIKATYKISIKKPSNGGFQEYMQLYSTKMVNDLKSHGCVDRKSLTLEFPNIEDEYVGSFLRGYFDGDGWIHEHITEGQQYKRFGLIGSAIFCSQLKNILLVKFGIKSLFHQPKNKKYAVLQIAAQDDVLRIRDIMYMYDTISLKRKKDKFYSKYSYVKSPYKKVYIDW